MDALCVVVMTTGVAAGDGRDTGMGVPTGVMMVLMATGFCPEELGGGATCCSWTCCIIGAPSVAVALAVAAVSTCFWPVERKMGMFLVCRISSCHCSRSCCCCSRML